MQDQKLILGYINFLDNNLSEAEKYFREIIESDPNNLVAIQNLIITMLRANKINETENLLKNLYERFKHRSRILRKLHPFMFLVKLKKGVIREAFEFFEKAYFDDMYIAPINWESTPSVIFNLKILFKLDEEILSKYKRWLSHPKRGENIINIRKELRQYIYLILKKRIHELTLHEKLIFSLIALSVNSTQEAYDILKSVEEEISEPLDMLLAGKLWYIFGKLKKAYTLFSQARVKLEPFYQYLALSNLALIYYRLGDYEVALEYIDSALKKKTDCYNCWYIRAKILMAQERWSEAERSLKLSLKYLKRNPDVWFDLSIIYLNRGKISQSIEAILTALKLGGDSEKISLLLEMLRYIKKGE